MDIITYSVYIATINNYTNAKSLSFIEMDNHDSKTIKIVERSRNGGAITSIRMHTRV